MQPICRRSGALQEIKVLDLMIFLAPLHRWYILRRAFPIANSSGGVRILDERDDHM
jgi:hypothetical protein